ncbi:hypothetical protein DA391_05455 [Yersinia massiliensis]|uniref:Uncharacterized protein n=1 Tax=Yersinia massiliensis TaxID=419257 RepID=A0ABM6UQK1_9GAMM|nr:hypothetical protein DA391_05455 [Yersinia massiliensis]
MFYIPVTQPRFLDLNQHFYRINKNHSAKFMFYINFINSDRSNFFCKFSTFFIFSGQKSIITSQTQV